jgi:hypothetical protein
MIWRLLWGLLLVWLVGCSSAPPVSIKHPTATSELLRVGVPDKSQLTPTPTVKRDTIPPKIHLDQQRSGRGIVPTPRAMTTVTGQAIDDSRVTRVTVNNKEANLDNNGNFSAQIYLRTSQNMIHVTAVDSHNNQASKTFRIDHQTTPVVVSPDTPSLSSGHYYALVIGINIYQNLPRLKTAVNDARAVAKVLKNQYGFQVTTLLDRQATRSNIVSQLNQLINGLDEDEHLLIYYAGHGYFDEQAQEAYWQPHDADTSEDTDWIISDRITSIINRSIANNILIVADSCYSGTLTRQGRGLARIPRSNRQRYLEKQLNTRSRLLMASGGDEPVSDSGGGKHSIFAKYFLQGLQNMNERAFTAEELFGEYINGPVQGGSSQTPNFQAIRKSGHEGGDFVFQKK